MCRIYKPKYMEDPASKTPEKDKNRKVDASLNSISKEAKDKETKPAGRQRSRSIWSRGKKDKTTAS
jgi:hypothetical protein